MLRLRSTRLWLALPVVALAACDNTPGLRDDGSPRRVVASPIDTGVYIGGTMTLHATLYDREGNVLPDPVTWSPSASGVTVSNAGVVAGTAYGRYWVRATAPGQATADDSVRVNVVPHGRLLAVEGHQGGNVLYAYDPDGSNRVVLTGQYRPTEAVWIPGTSSLVVAQLPPTSPDKALFVLGTDGSSRPLIATTPTTPTRQSAPAPSADGKWVFFVADGSWCPTASMKCIARVMTDGSGLEVVLPATSVNPSPSPSPDGSKVAYIEVTNSGFPNQSTIRVFDVATKTASTWSVTGNYPTWSPDGTRIAYVTPNNTIALIAPDGTGVRTLTTTEALGGAPQPISAIYGWSPDGKWLVTGGTLVEVATGLSIPVGYATGALVTSMK